MREARRTKASIPFPKEALRRVFCTEPPAHTRGRTLAVTVGNERASTDVRSNSDARVAPTSQRTFCQLLSSSNQCVSEIGNVGSGNCPRPRLHPYLNLLASG